MVGTRAGVVLLTGGAGFLGTQVARRLVAQTDHHIAVLVKARDTEAAERTLRRAYWDWPELKSAVGDRVEAIAGDITRPRFGLSPDAYARLVSSVTHVIHAAADIRLGAPLEELRPVNVGGTAEVVEFARLANADHGLARLAHVSTAYVAGRRTGVIREDRPTSEDGFTNFYEQTKFEAECMVHEASRDIPTSIFRPAMIVGDSRTGDILTFNTFYSPIRHYLLTGNRLVPAGAGLRINIIPVDYVADAIVRLTFDPAAAGLTFHLTAPRDSLPTADDLIKVVRAWESTHLGMTPPRPVEVPFKVGAPLLRLAEARLAALIPYFNEQRDFQRDNVDRLVGTYTLDWRKYVPKLLDFATARAFMHNSGRTVHEQIVFRLGSHAGTVTFHDIVEGEIKTRDAADVRREMLVCAVALQALGVRKGDRVAIAGRNSSRYLSLDVAIALCGAVSVPLAPTTSSVEIKRVLRSSHARVLLAGAPETLERLPHVNASIPVVSFWRGRLSGAHRQDVMTWHEFTARAAGRSAPAEAPVDLADVATVRYTPGRTGAPRGTVFTHAQLRWMARAVVSLLPWRTRKEHNRYLSFLPLNSVVDGMLCAYAGYNLPGPIDVYFLEDFRDLGAALSKVRPTIFFSTPGVYEKAWTRLYGNRFRQLAAKLPDPLERRALRALALHAMGLDRCAQLIVGSAPMRDSVLEAYRRVGIEIHNAYGVTEAPLVALNRIGRNHIGTVGEPLPETEVRIASDGEILVRGPQVAERYDDPSLPSPLEDGWLHTGDVGHLTSDGYLVLEGRRPHAPSRPSEPRQLVVAGSTG